MNQEVRKLLTKGVTASAPLNQDPRNQAMQNIKPAYKKLLAAQENSSDSSITRKQKKKKRKEARKEIRANRHGVREYDPFLYYFGKVDKDKVQEYQNAHGKSKGDLHSQRRRKVVIVTNEEENDDDDLDISSDFQFSSDEDDKTNPHYWNQHRSMDSLPENVRVALTKRQ